MIETCLKMNGRGYGQTHYVISSDRQEADVIVESFAAMIATGKIKVSYIDSTYPDEKLFKGIDDSYTNHYWENLVDADPSVSKVPELRPRSELLERLEAEEVK